MSEKLPQRAERRHYNRIDDELPVDLVFNGQNITTTTQNVSCGGMFLPLQKVSLHETEGITAFVKLPTRTEAVKLNGTVQRLELSADGTLVGVAVHFSGLYDEGRMSIDQYVKRKLSSH